jgi:hypothetical protein
VVLTRIISRNWFLNEHLTAELRRPVQGHCGLGAVNFLSVMRFDEGASEPTALSKPLPTRENTGMNLRADTG